MEGQTLAQRLAQGWRASPAILQQLTTQLLQALQAMRQAAGGPISHNAITPDNIILQHTPQGLQAYLANFASAEQLPGNTESSAAAHMPPAQLLESAQSEQQPSHAEASSSSWNVDVDISTQSQPMMQTHSSAAAEDAQLVTAALSEALATNVEYAAPEALGGEARMGASDAFSVGAVLAAAATGAAPQSSPSAPWVVPKGLEGSRLAAVIQRLLQPAWQRRLTPAQALAVLSGRPMPALPSLQPAAVSRPGIQVGLCEFAAALHVDWRWLLLSLPALSWHASLECHIKRRSCLAMAVQMADHPGNFLSKPVRLPTFCCLTRTTHIDFLLDGGLLCICFAEGAAFSGCPG